MEVEQDDAQVFRKLWNASHLEFLSSGRCVEEIKSLKKRLLEINGEKFIGGGGILEDSEIRALNLFQQSVSAIENMMQRLRESTKRAFTSIEEVITLGLKYYHIHTTSEENLKLSLRRIGFRRDDSFLLSTILPRESNTFYIEYLINVIFSEKANLFSLWNRDDTIVLRQPIASYLNRRESTHSFCDYIARYPYDLMFSIESTKEHLPVQFEQKGFRRAVVLNIAYKFYNDSQRRPNELSLLKELPPFSELEVEEIEDFLYLGNSYADSERLKYRKLFEELKEWREREEKNRDVEEALLAQDVLLMSVDELCHHVKSQNGRVGVVLKYQEAFRIRFSHSLELDPHQALMNMTKLIKSFSFLIEQGVFLLSEEFIQAYNEMLAIFLLDIPMTSTSDLDALCPCCQMTFTQCLVDFEGIEKWVPLSEENECKLKEALALVKLPLIEVILNYIEEEKRCEELVEEMIEDDGLELGHFDESDSEMDNLL